MSAITAVYLLTGPDEDFGPRADGLATLHTFENSDPLKIYLRDAIAGARWQDDPSVLGSYGRLIGVDGVLLTVPDDHASGGINPGSAYFKPKQWLWDTLDPDIVRNPNYFTLNLCAMGQRLYFDTYGWPAGIIDGFAKSIIDESNRIGRLVTITDHYDFQTNRTDAGGAKPLVVKRINQLIAEPAHVPAPAPAPAPQEIIVDFSQAKHQIPKVVRIREGAVLYKQPSGDAVHWTVPAGEAFDAELLLGIGERFLCRRRGQGPTWWIGMDAIDRDQAYVLATYGAPPPVDTSAIEAKLTEAEERIQAIKAKAAAFSDDVQDD